MENALKPSRACRCYAYTEVLFVGFRCGMSKLELATWHKFALFLLSVVEALSLRLRLTAQTNLNFSHEPPKNSFFVLTT